MEEPLAKFLVELISKHADLILEGNKEDGFGHSTWELITHGSEEIKSIVEILLQHWL